MCLTRPFTSSCRVLSYQITKENRLVAQIIVVRWQKVLKFAVQIVRRESGKIDQVHL